MNLSSVELSLPLGLGFFAGMAIIAAIGNWLKFVLALRQSVSPKYPPTPPRALGWFPILAFISPVPWLAFLGLPFAAYYFIRVRHSASAMAFFLSIGALMFVWLLGSALLIWRLRKRPTKPQT